MQELKSSYDYDDLVRANALLDMKHYFEEKEMEKAKAKSGKK